MARRRSERMIVTKVTGVGADRTTRREPDELIVEEPMSIQLDGTLVSTTMRTPGNDYELAAGFCFTEGLLAGAPVIGVRYCADDSAVGSEFNVVTVETGGRAPTPTPRLGNTSSSCGWCGSDQINDLVARLDPVPPTDPISLDVIAAMPDRVLQSQGLFRPDGLRTCRGGVHPRGRGHGDARRRRTTQCCRQSDRRDAARPCSVVLGAACDQSSDGARTLREWPSEHRDGAESVGRRILDGGGGQRPDRISRGRRAPIRDAARGVRPRSEVNVYAPERLAGEVSEF